MSGSFPWARLMRAGLGQLKLEPDAFWGMTPRELVAACGAQSARSMRRDELLALMEVYPDA